MSYPADVIDALVGIAPGDLLDDARNVRQEARQHAQGSFMALFAPQFPGTVTEVERLAVATFVAVLHRVPEVVEFYRDHLSRASAGNPTLVAAVLSEAAHGLAEGPYGSYPDGPLADESVPGPEFAVDESVESYVLGRRLAAALNHAHFLVLHPRDASPERLQRLLDAGWSTTEVVTLSQLVAFLSYQIRVVAGLSALKLTATKEASLR